MADSNDSAPTALLALAAQTTKHAVIITGADDRIQWVNQGFTDLTGWTFLTGWTLSEVIGKTPGSLMNGPKTDPETARQFREHLERGERFSTTVQCSGKWGQTFWLKVEKEPVYNDRGELENFVSIETDVTRYVHQEAQLNKSEGRLQDAVEALRDGFALYDADDRLVICNERYKEIYAASAPFIIEGTRFEDLLRAGLERGQYLDAAEDPEAWLQERMAAHLSATGEVTEQQLDDGRWLHIRESKTRDGGVVGIRTDVTAMKEAQLAAEQARARAEVANEAKSTFLATMSHELRTPMTSILGLLDLLQDTDLDDTQKGYVDNLADTAENLLLILNDILDLSKIEAGHLKLLDKEFSPSELADSIRTLFLQTAQAKGIEIILDIDPDIPGRVLGDPARMRQILTNLVGNAVKFTQEGTISICLRLTGEMLIYEVQDSGIGIEEEHLDHIFQPFSQADGTISRRYGGTGLGLSICQRLVSAMGGKIRVTSTPDVGSTFRVEIPYRQAEYEHPAEQTQPGSVSQQEDDANLPPLSVLIAEDVALNRAIVENMLTKQGHATQGAENGVDAVQKIRKNGYDLVLMDIRMPVMDGITATRIIRADESGNGKHVPIIALTADALDSQRDEFIAAGIDAVITKPVDWSNLKRTIRTVISDDSRTQKD